MARTKTTSQAKQAVLSRRPKKKPKAAKTKTKTKAAGARKKAPKAAEKPAKAKAAAKPKPAKAKAAAKAPKVKEPRPAKAPEAVASVAPVVAVAPVDAEESSRPAKARKAPKQPRVTVPQLVEIGKATLGIEALRPGQEEALGDILAGRDVLAVMPTGSGKSLLYQLPSLVLPGLTVVVSPLIALITDQVEKMKERGVAVARVDSTLTVRQKRAMMELVNAPGGKLLLTTPERMADPEFRKVLGQAAGTVGVSLFVVDEAHCVSQWGHDFRPAYLTLGQSVEELGRPQLLATTATAPPHVRDDILHQLGIPRARIVTTSFERPNLSFEVIASPGEDDKKKVLIALLKKLKRPGIVYCATVKAVEELGEELARHGIPVATYHGRMNKGERDDMQSRFMEKRSKLVMIATNAFGLGVDKPDIRYVIHYHMPGSLEQYAQEAGRGGRDGLPARCVMLFSPDDVAIQEYFLKGTYPTRRQVMAVLESLEAWLGEGKRPTLAELAMAAHVGSQRTRTVVALMKDEGWIVEEKGGHYHLADPPPHKDKVRDRAREYEKRRIADRQRLDALLEYVRVPTCRNAVILDYLGEKGAKTVVCGRCDNDLRSSAETRAAARNAEELEEVLARQTAEAEGELGDDFVKPAARRARTRLISLDGPREASPPPAAEAHDETTEVEPIERTAAELAEDESDSTTEITVLKRKKKAPVHHPHPAAHGGGGHGGAHPARARGGRDHEQQRGGKRHRRRKGKDHKPLGQVAPPGAFTSPVLVVPPGHSRSHSTPPASQSSPPASSSASGPADGAAPPSAASPAPHAPHPHHPRPATGGGRGAGPIVEYVRRPMKIALAPVASASPHDTGGGRRRNKRGGPKPSFTPRPSQAGGPPGSRGGPPGPRGAGQPHHRHGPAQGHGAPPAPGSEGPKPTPAMAGAPGGAAQPGTPSPPGMGKRRRRRRRRGGAGAQPGGPPPANAANAQTPPLSPTQRFWMPAGAPLPTSTSTGTPAASPAGAPPNPTNGAGAAFTAPNADGQSGHTGQPGMPGQPGSGKKRRRRRRRRGGAAGPWTGAPPPNPAGGPWAGAGPAGPNGAPGGSPSGPEGASGESPPNPNGTPRAGGASTVPHGGTSTAPHGGASSSPRGGASTPPHGGAGTAPHDGAKTGPHGGSGTPHGSAWANERPGPGGGPWGDRASSPNGQPSRSPGDAAGAPARSSGDSHAAPPAPSSPSASSGPPRSSGGDDHGGQ